jgi:hypothetical protein
MEPNKVKFAQEQYSWLKNQGIKNRLRLSRIFKASGPGQLQDAWKLASSFLPEDAATSEALVAVTEAKDTINIAKDALECVLWGILRTKMDPDKAQDILDFCGYFVPQMENKRTFLRVVEGALEILVPGSFRFSPEEMNQIRDGLKKRMDEDGEVSENVDEVEDA